MRQRLDGSRLARAAAVTVLAACGAGAPSSGTGAPLPDGATPAAAASGLRMGMALSRGALAYATAFDGNRVVAVELGATFELVVRERDGDEVSRVALGAADWDVGDLAAQSGRAWVASLDGTVRGIDLATGDVAARWHLGAPATAVAVSLDGAYIATGDDQGVVCLRRAADGALLQCVAAHAGAVGDLAFADARLASAGWSGEVIVWEVPSLRVALSRARAGAATAVAFSPDGRRLAVGGSRTPPRRSPTIAERERREGFAAPDPLAAIEIVALDLDPGREEIVHAGGHAAAVTALAWTPDGRRVVSASWDRTVRLWNAGTGAPLARLGGFAHLVRGVAVSDDGRHAAAAAWAPSIDARATTIVELLYP